MDEEDRPDVSRLASRAPGADPDDPYEDVDVASLPAWWRRAVSEFEAHDLRPYRPPRLADGTPLHDVAARLERELGASITFGTADEDFRDRWTVRVDGDPAGKVGRHRSAEGYTVFEVDPDELASLVRQAADDV